MLNLQTGVPGLVVVDSLAAETPIVVYADKCVSAEADYLRAESNAIVVVGTTAEDFAREVVSALKDDNRLKRLREGCSRDATQYSLANMVMNFESGVLRALSLAEKPIGAPNVPLSQIPQTS